MLIKRQSLFTIDVVVKIVSKPVGEAGDRLDRLPILPFTQSRSATAGIIGDHKSKPFIFGTCPERRLPPSGVPQNGHPGIIYPLIHLEVVHSTTRPPAPGGQRSPGISRTLIFSQVPFKHADHSQSPGFGIIRRQLPVLDSGDAISPPDHPCSRPEARSA